MARRSGARGMTPHDSLDVHAPPEPAGPPGKTRVERMLDTIERVGNKVPHPAVIFVMLIGIVIVLSHIFYMFGASVTFEAINPDTDELEEITTAAQSLMTADGLRFMFE